MKRMKKIIVTILSLAMISLSANDKASYDASYKRY